jgi:solute carrier family 8 (sodium/calcium exchanger)
MNNGLMGICYMVGLFWLFCGIGIISDIFMEAIEVMVSQTKELELFDKKAEKKYVVEVNVWNETVANLTLMALGSSAPEILLSVFSTVGDLYAKPPVLGASTIVGSAAFNLLVITGVSILAVGEEPKKVKDTGVFAVTSIASLFAYIWLYLVLGVITPGEVTTAEGWLTLIYFIVLITMAYGADKLNNYFEQ